MVRYNSILIPLWVIALLLVVLLLAKTHGVLWAKETAVPEMGVIFFLSSDEVDELKWRAEKNGDWLAAKLLMRYYGAYEKNPVEATKWLEAYHKLKKRDSK